MKCNIKKSFLVAVFFLYLIQIKEMASDVSGIQCLSEALGKKAEGLFTSTRCSQQSPACVTATPTTVEMFAAPAVLLWFSKIPALLSSQWHPEFALL